MKFGILIHNKHNYLYFDIVEITKAPQGFPYNHLYDTHEEATVIADYICDSHNVAVESESQYHIGKERT